MAEDTLSELLSEFARTLITDFPIQAILDHLVVRIVEVLPITAAGVTLISPGSAPHYVAASDDAALRFERLQTESGQGPCMLAYESGQAVAVPDLAAEDRFPVFVSTALSAGLAAAFTFPLRHGDGRLGALDLYRDTPGPLGQRDMAIAQTLADVTAAYVLNAQAREEARETSDRFRRSSLHDALTGLPNRLLLQQRIELAAQRAERSHTDAAVLFADLDRFKQINDTYGHQVGDDLLVAIAQRLGQLVRPGDTLARVSGDEFVFLCENLRSADDLDALADRIRRALQAPFEVSGLQLSVTASVGMAYAAPGQTVTNQLVIDADIAMYQAKSKGGAAHQFIDLRQARESMDRTSLEQDLRAAFALDDLDVAYQPIVRTSDGFVTGVEALLRWTHPVRGPIASLDMVSIAEDNGFIIEVGAWVLHRGCLDRAQWLREHPHQPLDLAVNVSTLQLLSPHFSATVADTLKDTGMDPGALILEMTEGILIQDAERAVTVLADLKTLGVRLALDDFGTGFSSLNYLRQFPVDILKIDRSFITALSHDSTCEVIVSAICNLAHHLGLTVIAEGIETGGQREDIISLGCDSGQGFLYAAGMHASEIAVLLAAHRPHGLHLPVSTTGEHSNGRSMTSGDR